MVLGVRKSTFFSHKLRWTGNEEKQVRVRDRLYQNLQCAEILIGLSTEARNKNGHKLQKGALWCDHVSPSPSTGDDLHCASSKQCFGGRA